MTSPVSNSNLGYLDFSGLGQLRGDAAQKKAGSLEKTAEQFEAMFVQMMMKSMREAVVKDEENTSNAGDMYQDLMDRELSVQFAKRRTFGIADMLTRQLNHQAPANTQAMLEGRTAVPAAHPLKPEAIKAYKLDQSGSSEKRGHVLPVSAAIPLNSSGVQPIQEEKAPPLPAGTGVRRSDEDNRS